MFLRRPSYIPESLTETLLSLSRLWTGLREVFEGVVAEAAVERFVLLYGELMCNADLYGYAKDGLPGTHQVFGAMLHPADPAGPKLKRYHFTGYSCDESIEKLQEKLDKFRPGVSEDEYLEEVGMKFRYMSQESRRHFIVKEAFWQKTDSRILNKCEVPQKKNLTTNSYVNPITSRIQRSRFSYPRDVKYYLDLPGGRGRIEFCEQFFKSILGIGDSYLQDSTQDAWETRFKGNLMPVFQNKYLGNQNGAEAKLLEEAMQHCKDEYIITGSHYQSQKKTKVKARAYLSGKDNKIIKTVTQVWSDFCKKKDPEAFERYRKVRLSGDTSCKIVASYRRFLQVPLHSFSFIWIFRLFGFNAMTGNSFQRNIVPVIRPSQGP